jgi:bifunctional DNase/RNase
MMLTMRVLRLVVHVRTHEPVLLLGEVEGERCLPVFLRRPQADVIALGERGENDPELPQDVLVPILTALGHELVGAEVVALENSVFQAELVFADGARVSLRPSDALAVAVRLGLPIGVADKILDDVGQPIADLFPDGTDAPPEKQLADFKKFIDEVSPEDFGA